nr:protein EARLY-RESPONSIVE TO DEHYDRATION 7, chloroplastic-like [Ipomoea batatas]
MASQDPTRSPMYPKVVDPDFENPFHSSSPSANRAPMYPVVDMKDVENLFPENYETVHGYYQHSPSAPPEAVEETLLIVPGAILHLIDKQYSVELATGDLALVSIRQGDNTVAVFARVADEIQWPLTKDLASVKLDNSHYFFSFKFPNVDDDSDSSDEEKSKGKKEGKQKEKQKDMGNDVLNYGLTIASKGQDNLIKDLDTILDNCSSFSVHKVEETASVVMGGPVAKEVSPADLKSEKKKEILEGRCAAYWTTLAPNVEDYSSSAARLMASGSGKLIKGILWCGDVTVDNLKSGDEVLRKRMTSGSKAEVSPETMKRIRRVKRVTSMTEKVATGVLSGVVKVSGFFTSSVANSSVGKKFLGLLPGEMVLATLDGFSRICDAVEVAGKNVMSTSSTVTTGLVSHKYGDEAAKATSEGLEAAGHAMATAWTVFKLRKALNPKSALKPTSLAKAAAAAEMKAKNSPKKS